MIGRRGFFGALAAIAMAPLASVRRRSPEQVTADLYQYLTRYEHVPPRPLPMHAYVYSSGDSFRTRLPVTVTFSPDR